MKAKQEIIFEVEKNERVYKLSMPEGAPLGEAYEASAEFMQEVVRLINEHVANLKKASGEEELKEDEDDQKRK